MNDIQQLFTMMWIFKARGLDSRSWAVMPKKSASERVTRHFMRHQRQLQNAKNSGIGFNESQRRRRQIAAGILRTN